MDAIAVAHDGKTIVTASRDGAVHVRDANDLAVREVLQSEGGGVRVLAFVDDGATFVSGGEDGTIASWHIDGRALGRRDAGVGAIADAAWTPQGLVVGGEAGLATLGATAEPLGAFVGVTAIASSGDGTI